MRTVARGGQSGYDPSAPMSDSGSRGEPSPASPTRILVVDDEPSLRDLLTIMLRKEGYEVTTAESRAQAAEKLSRTPVAMVITDLKLPDGDGIELLRHVKAVAPETIVIVITAYGSAQTAVAALRLGAHDYLVKPFDVDELKIVVRGALEKQHLREENLLLKRESKQRLEQIMTASPAMTSVLNTVRSIASTGATVLISGESGTGKELVARALHNLSPRRDAPFVSVNCGALPENLLETELFGHMKGAFTDAHQNKKGLFEVAHRGTLFLDEVGDTPPAMQVKLLRTLQDMRIRRLGGTEEILVDVWVIAASNRSLEGLMKEGRFRADLFYRLNVLPLSIPPLRERQEDIPLLAEHFVRRFSQEMGKKIQGIEAQALSRLRGYHWPGNVRELENAMRRAVALENGATIGVDRIADLLPGAAPAGGDVHFEAGFRLAEYLSSIEMDLVTKALEASRGSRGEAARLLGVTPRTLRYLLSKYRGRVGANGEN
jgi:two-component system, NtrC family, response regulator PilR